jgi:hypothetical protein
VSFPRCPYTFPVFSNVRGVGADFSGRSNQSDGGFRGNGMTESYSPLGITDKNAYGSETIY